LAVDLGCISSDDGECWIWFKFDLNLSLIYLKFERRDCVAFESTYQPAGARVERPGGMVESDPLRQKIDPQ
jgi:hypothetical protein